MANDITFILKARNEARRAVREFDKDLKIAADATDEVSKATKQAAKDAQQFDGNVREAAKSTAQLGQETETVRREATLAARAFGLLTRAVTALAGVLGSIGASALPFLLPGFLPARIAGIATAVGGLVTAIGGLAVLGTGTARAKSFNAALAETSTLIEGTPTQLREITDATRDFVRTFGGNQTQQVEAFYQAISAGAENIPAATRIVEEANKLAVGGVTSVATGVDILTTAVNAYGPSVLSAQEASDSLFVAVRAGKTTVDELAASLGRVIPLAATAGVSLDELNAFVATLTTQGIATAEAVTGARAALQAVIRPTQQAKDTAAALGVEFDVAALQSKGLRQFLTEVIEAADGNTEALGQLFGSTEALAAILAVAGGGAQRFGEILEDQANKAGEADRAYRKVAESVSKRFDDALASIGQTLTDLGNKLLPAITLALEAFAGVLEIVSDNADLLLIAFTVLTARGVLGLIGALGRGRAALGAFSAAQGLVATASKALSAALSGNFAALSTLTAGAGRATIAMRALAFAMSTLPLIALSVFVGGVVRAFTESSQAAEAFAEKMADSEAALEGLNAALTVFSSDASRAAAEGLRRAADTTVASLQAALAAAERELQAAEFFTNFFGVNLFETDRIKAAQAEIARLRDELARVQAVGSAAQARLDAFAIAAGGTAEQLREQAQAQGTVGEATFETVPAVAELRNQYGGLAETVAETLRLQNELAIVNGQISMGNLLAEASQFLDLSGLAASEVANINQRLVDIRSTDALGDASQKALALAQEIIKANGGVESLDANTRQAVEKLVQAALQAANVDANARSASGAISTAAGNAAVLAGNLQAAAGALGALQSAVNSLALDTIGKEAQNMALRAGGDLIASRRAGLLAQREAELAPALEQGGLAAEIARQQLDEYTIALDKNLASTRENARLQEAFRESLQSASGGSSGGGGGGGGGGGLSEAAQQAQQAAEAREALNNSVQQTIRGYQDEIELLGLYGEELEFAKEIQRLQNEARAQGIELTQQQIRLIEQERQALLNARAAADTFSNGFKAGLAEISQSAQTNIGFARDFTVQAFNGMTDAIVSLVTTGKADFKGLLVDLLKSISQFLAQRLVMNFLNAFGAGLSPGGMGGTGAIGGLGFLGRAAAVRMAGGGRVVGPGTETSDSIPALLSRNEFVTNAQATRQFLPLLTAINANRGEEYLGRLTAQAYAMGAEGAARGSLSRFEGQGQTIRERQINMTFNFPGANPDTFRRSEGQIRARMARLIDEADIRDN